MATYEVLLKDGSVEHVVGADTYEQEGPLTTFFELAPDRQVIDCWSVRLSSIRTTEIMRIRRAAGEAGALASVSELRAG